MTMLAALLVICALIAATTAMLLRADEPEVVADKRLQPFDYGRAERLAPELVTIAPPWMSDADRRAWATERARDHS